jgi:GT2 family glycosyltransferase
LDVVRVVHASEKWGFGGRQLNFDHMDNPANLPENVFTYCWRNTVENETQPELWRTKQFLAKAGVEVEDLSPEFWLSEPDECCAEVTMNRGDILGVFPGADHPNRRWPVSNWIRLIAEQAVSNTIAILGGSRETTLAQEIETGLLAANLGFTGGNNVGIRIGIEAGADYILLLNNDTLVAPDLLATLVGAAQKWPEAGVYSAKIYYADQPTTFWFAGGDLGELGEEGTHRGMGEIDQGQFDVVSESSFVSGCVVFVRTDVLRKVGLLDERYFCMWEDVDWSIRFVKAGFRPLYIPQARVWHKASRSLGGVMSPMAMYYYERNRLLLMSIHQNGFHRASAIMMQLRRIWWSIRSGPSLRSFRDAMQYFRKNASVWLGRLLGITDFTRGYCREARWHL